MTSLTCPRCADTFWSSSNPVELDAWRCSCTPAQTLPDIDGYLTPTPEAPTTASLVGLTPDGASPAPSGVAQLDERSRAELTEGAKAAALALVGAFIGLGFAALVVREVVGRIGGA